MPRTFRTEARCRPPRLRWLSRPGWGIRTPGTSSRHAFARLRAQEHGSERVGSLPCLHLRGRQQALKLVDAVKQVEGFRLAKAAVEDLSRSWHVACLRFLHEHSDKFAHVVVRHRTKHGAPQRSHSLGVRITRTTRI